MAELPAIVFWNCETIAEEKNLEALFLYKLSEQYITRLQFK